MSTPTLYIHGGAGGSMQIEFNGESVQAIATDRDRWRERYEWAESECDELRQALAAHRVAGQWGRELWLACWMVAMDETRVITRITYQSDELDDLRDFVRESAQLLMLRVSKR